MNNGSCVQGPGTWDPLVRCVQQSGQTQAAQAACNGRWPCSFRPCVHVMQTQIHRTTLPARSRLTPNRPHTRFFQAPFIACQSENHPIGTRLPTVHASSPLMQHTRPTYKPGATQFVPHAGSRTPRQWTCCHQPHRPTHHVTRDTATSACGMLAVLTAKPAADLAPCTVCVYGAVTAGAGAAAARPRPTCCPPALWRWHLPACLSAPAWTGTRPCLLPGTRPCPCPTRWPSWRGWGWRRPERGSRASRPRRP
mmetsp:Transcript_8081/g.20204  ORF Transcript_8081/g.20204 Transcript_8081/m.20204 type:complete len:252 (-) Transcript_8081:2512-3267(-)